MNNQKWRMLAHYSFEDNSFIQITIAGDVDTAEAITAVEHLLALKKQELAALPAPPPISGTGQNDEVG